MAKLANKQEMYADGWVDDIINDISVIKLVVENDYTMIAQWTMDGFTTHKAAKQIQQELGQAYKIHTLFDPKRKTFRISCLEYI